jgi:phage antirepressor YoqD-like protein
MMTIGEVAQKYGMPEYRVRRWVREKAFHTVAAGAKTLVNEKSFLRFLGEEVTSDDAD